MDGEQRIRIHLAGASGEHARVAMMAATLRRSGLFELHNPWWESAPMWTGTDATHDRESQRAIANAHMAAIDAASLTWCLWPVSHSFGAYIELGYALGVPDNVVCVTGPTASSSVFTACAHYRDVADAFGLDFCCRIARELLGKAVRT